VELMWHSGCRCTHSSLCESQTQVHVWAFSVNRNSGLPPSREFFSQPWKRDIDLLHVC
jgi:hypothetical protein